jgi:hypothetical protein
MGELKSRPTDGSDPAPQLDKFKPGPGTLQKGKAAIQLKKYHFSAAALETLQSLEIRTVSELLGFAGENPQWKRELLARSECKIPMVREIEIVVRRHSNGDEKKALPNDEMLKGHLSGEAVALIAEHRPSDSNGEPTVNDLARVLAEWHRQHKHWRLFAQQQMKSVDKKTLDEIEIFIMTNNIDVGSKGELRRYVDERTDDVFRSYRQIPLLRQPTIDDLRLLVSEWSESYGDWKVGLRGIPGGERVILEIEELIVNKGLA